jgi:hypothetical protein
MQFFFRLLSFFIPVGISDGNRGLLRSSVPPENERPPFVDLGGVARIFAFQSCHNPAQVFLPRLKLLIDCCLIESIKFVVHEKNWCAGLIGPKCLPS